MRSVEIVLDNPEKLPSWKAAAIKVMSDLINEGLILADSV